MDEIYLENIRLYANHGCLKEEALIGSLYRVDLWVKADLTQSALTDDLTDTVDYVHLNHIVKEEMAVRSNLLEQVAKRINLRVLRELNQVDEIKVKVAKINPPIGGDVQSVSIAMTSKR